MTLEELKAYTDALIDATGDENLKRVRAKMDQVELPFVPPRLTAPAPIGWPTVTCGKANFDTDPNIQVVNA